MTVIPARHALFLAGIAVSLATLLPQAATCITLESAYLSASARNGYDKYVELSAATTYTGGLSIPGGDTACIKGNGALIDLQGSSIQVGGSTCRLDIDHCVLINGGDPVWGTVFAALRYTGSSGNVTNNTIYANTVGVRVYSTAPNAVTIKNNILTNNTNAGVLCELGSEANISYNDGWHNLGYGNYALDYQCVGGGIKAWTPVPGTGNISADPLFVNAAAYDFHLTTGSPCIAAGDPPGTDMGALGDPTPVEPITWGKIKSMFAR